MTWMRKKGKEAFTHIYWTSVIPWFMVYKSVDQRRTFQFLYFWVPLLIVSWASLNAFQEGNQLAVASTEDRGPEAKGKILNMDRHIRCRMEQKKLNWDSNSIWIQIFARNMDIWSRDNLVETSTVSSLLSMYKFSFNTPFSTTKILLLLWLWIQYMKRQIFIRWRITLSAAIAGKSLTPMIISLSQIIIISSVRLCDMNYHYGL